MNPITSKYIPSIETRRMELNALKEQNNVKDNSQIVLEEQRYFEWRRKTESSQNIDIFA